MDDQERKAYELVRDELAVQEGRLYAHIADSFKWLMATLFAANGGAMLALVNDSARDLPGRLYALGWFAGGTICSLLVGVLTTYAAFRGVSAMSKMRIALHEALITDQSAFDKLNAYVASQKFTWRTWLPSYAAGASLALFVIGLLTIAGSLLRAG